jgi:hypothetical protein
MADEPGRDAADAILRARPRPMGSARGGRRTGYTRRLSTHRPVARRCYGAVACSTVPREIHTDLNMNQSGSQRGDRGSHARYHCDSASALSGVNHKSELSCSSTPKPGYTPPLHFRAAFNYLSSTFCAAHQLDHGGHSRLTTDIPECRQAETYRRKTCKGT